MKLKWFRCVNVNGNPLVGAHKRDPDLIRVIVLQILALLRGVHGVSVGGFVEGYFEIMGTWICEYRRSRCEVHPISVWCPWEHLRGPTISMSPSLLAVSQ